MIEERKLEFPVLELSKDSVLEQFGANTVPTIIVIDKNRNVRFRGSVSNLEDLLEDLMN